MVTFLYGLVVEAITLNVLVSTKLEEVLTEMKLPAFYEEVSSSGATYSSILCFNFLCICQVFIEEKEGKKEEDTGAVQGTLGPSASYIYIKNPFRERNTLFRI